MPPRKASDHGLSSASHRRRPGRPDRRTPAGRRGCGRTAAAAAAPRCACPAGTSRRPCRRRRRGPTRPSVSASAAEDALDALRLQLVDARREVEHQHAAAASGEVGGRAAPRRRGTTRSRRRAGRSPPSRARAAAAAAAGAPVRARRLRSTAARGCAETLMRRPPRRARCDAPAPRRRPSSPPAATRRACGRRRRARRGRPGRARARRSRAHAAAWAGRRSPPPLEPLRARPRAASGPPRRSPSRSRAASPQSFHAIAAAPDRQQRGEHQQHDATPSRGGSGR